LKYKQWKGRHLWCDFLLFPEQNQTSKNVYIASAVTIVDCEVLVLRQNVINNVMEESFAPLLRANISKETAGYSEVVVSTYML
jgi:hypothetical protein